jgi:hypothetical protein
VPTRAERVAAIEALQAARAGSVVIVYVTSTRPNLEVLMAMDAIPIVYRHLATLETPPAETRIDLFLHSNGGESIAPWRLITLLREFCSELTVLIPNRAFSAATLAALGADKVLMHPMGMLGPTDPTVTSPFNPLNPQNPNQLLGISVEDVASFIGLVKDDVGIRHEEELVQAFGHLAREIHPLALGTVKRATSQSRMMGQKLLRLRGGNEIDEHAIDEIVQELTSRLYFHGHPINRREARDDLRLAFVEDPPSNVEEAMWTLFELYETDMRLNEEFMPLQEAYAQQAVGVPGAPPMVNPGQLGLTTITTATVELEPVKTVYVESASRTDVRTATFEVTLRREWTGDLNANFAMTASGWQEET